MMFEEEPDDLTVTNPTILNKAIKQKAINSILIKLNQIGTKLTRGRKVKVSGYKKAIITLKKGQSIDLTTGI